MATKKATPKPKAKPKAPPPAAPPGRLQNLAARPTSYSAAGSGDALLDEEQLVDSSGVFRVTSAITQAQIGHEDDGGPARFASDSLVMAAQRDNFREHGTSPEDAADAHATDDEAAAADRRSRIATLAARAQATPKPRSRR